MRPNVRIELDLWSPLKVKTNSVVGLLTYDFLLVLNSNHISISQRFGCCSWSCPTAYHWNKIRPPTYILYSCVRFLLKIDSYIFLSKRESSPTPTQKVQLPVDQFNNLEVFCWQTCAKPPPPPKKKKKKKNRSFTIKTSCKADRGGFLIT